MTVFYSSKLETCVQAAEREVGNDFVISDVTRDFVRLEVDEPNWFGTLCTCDADGVNNVLIDKVRQHRGFVFRVPNREWMDDYNGGNPATVQTAPRPYTRKDCEVLFERKLTELR